MGKSDRPFIGIDLGGTNIQAGVVAGTAEVVGRAKAKTRADQGPKVVVQRIAQVAREALEDAGLCPADVGGLGIGAPGPVNIDKGIVLNAPNLRWTRFPLAEALRGELKLPVAVDNDVNVGTWGEHAAGAGRNFDDMLGVFVGTGIGGGIVLGGKLYYGHYLTAGEIGHTVVQADAPVGRRTLENLASRTAVVNLLVQLVQANHPSKIVEMVGSDLGEIRSKVIAKALETGDPLTEQVLQQAAKYVAVAIANAVTVMSLPCVVVGGGLTTAAGKPWIEWIRKWFEQFVFPVELRACKITASKLGDDAGVVGAALLAQQRLSGKPRPHKS